MFQLSRSGEYAIQTMINLVSQKDELSTIAQIVQEERIPESFVRKIIQQLIRGKLLKSKRGIRGGIALAKPPSSITVYDIIEITEGPIYFNKCIIGPRECSITSWCSVHPVWQEAQNKFVEVLQKKTIEDLSNERKVLFRDFTTKVNMNKEKSDALQE
ncbi:MAG: Rrf2 family transcriptional regulator [Ignavibacteria bacterium]|nr:Rrf2 family transcriptional regulator [Ignavibacteria bacterium]